MTKIMINNIMINVMIYVMAAIMFNLLTNILIIVHTVIIEDIQELFQIEDAFWGCGQTLFK